MGSIKTTNSGTREWRYRGNSYKSQTKLANSLGLSQDLLSAAIKRSPNDDLDSIIDKLIQNQKRISEIIDIDPGLRDAIIANPDESAAALGKQFGVGRETVRNRMKDLYCTGVIDVAPPSNANSVSINVHRKNFDSATELGRKYGIPYSLITDRFRKKKKKAHKKGVPFDETAAWEYAISLGPDRGNRKALEDGSGKIWETHRDAADHHGVSAKTLSNRINMLDWQYEAALTPVGQVSCITHENQTYILYVYKEISTGRVVYVGITIDLERRHKAHMSTANRGKFTPGSFDEALALHGENAFEYYALAEFNTPEKMIKAECEAITKYDTLDNGFNKHPGGGWSQSPAVMVQLEDQVFSSIASFARYCDLDERVVRHRLQVLDWTPGQCAGIEPRKQTTQKIPIVLDGKEYESYSEAERQLNLKAGTIGRLKKHGLTDAYILTRVCGAKCIP